MKNSITISINVLVVVLVLFFSATFIPTTKALAQEEQALDKYTPLEALPDASGAIHTGAINVNDFFTTVYFFSLTAAVFLAVIMIIYGGLQYMARGVSESVAKGAKDKIFNALKGLLLALLSYLILSTINPDLTKPSLFVPRMVGTPVTTPTTGGTGSPGGTTGGTTSQAKQEEELAMRSAWRAQGITVQGNICETTTQTKCTNIVDLPPTVLPFLLNLQNDCGGCDVVVTAGAEAGHKEHGAGTAVIDLKVTSSLTEYLTDGGTIPLSCGAVYAGHYRYETETCVSGASAPHFHASLNSLSPIK